MWEIMGRVKDILQKIVSFQNALYGNLMSRKWPFVGYTILVLSPSLVQHSLSVHVGRLLTLDHME